MHRMTTREILAESFRELAENKLIDKITIREITDNCGYSPATFDRNFKDKYDLIAWEYSCRIEKIMARAEMCGNNWRQALIEVLHYYQSEKEYLSNLLTHTSGHDSFIQYMAQINEAALTRFIQELTGQTHMDQKTELLIRLFCIGTVTLGSEWILGKYNISAEELAEVCADSVPVPLRPLLLRE